MRTSKESNQMEEADLEEQRKGLSEHKGAFRLVKTLRLDSNAHCSNKETREIKSIWVKGINKRCNELKYKKIAQLQCKEN